MKLFQYSTTSSLKKNPQHKLFCYFCHSSSQLRLFTFFFSEGKYQAHSGSNCTLKPECWTLTIYILYIVYGIDASLMDWWHYVRLGWENSHSYLNLSFQQYRYLAHWQFREPFCFLQWVYNAGNGFQLFHCF